MVGIKPSRGRVSNHPDANPRGGLITHGPIARTVSDAALMLDVMAGAEPGDPFLAPEQTPSFREASAQDPSGLRIGMLDTSDKWIDPQVVAAVRKAGELLASLGHRVEPAQVDLTGLGRVFRVMVEAESAANDVGDPALFSDPYSRWCYERGVRQTAVEYIRATEEMFRRSREIILASMAVGLPAHAHRHPAAATARHVPRGHGAGRRRRSRLYPVHLSLQHLGTAGDLAAVGLDR